jgi:molybdopterin/thiamine biosynthesis adenylyltransferase
MLSENEKALLDAAFAREGLKELTLQQGGKIAAQTKLPLRAVEWFALDSGILPCRYERNIGSIGIEGQKKLLESSVIVVGLGGLGGYVVEELARAGVGRIAGVDPDEFEENNLNRQLLSVEGNLGKKKTAEAGERVKKINKAVEFAGYDVSLEELAEEIWGGTDLVFDCLDNIEDRLSLAGKCSAVEVPLIHGAIAGWYGEVGVVWPGTAALAKIYGNQKQGIEQNIGTPPFTAAAAGSLMAAEGIKVLTGKNTVKESKLLYFDLLEDDWQRITF